MRALCDSDRKAFSWGTTTMSGRFFLIDDDDTLRRLSAKCFNGLINSDPAVTMREFAGRRVRYAVAIVETEQRRVIGIRFVECGFFQFNKVGALDQKAWRLGRAVR